MKGVGRVTKSIHQSWLAKGLGFRLLCWGFKEVQKEIPSEEARTIQIGLEKLLEKLLEPYNKCIAAGGDYFEGD